MEQENDGCKKNDHNFIGCYNELAKTITADNSASGNLKQKVESNSEQGNKKCKNNENFEFQCLNSISYQITLENDIENDIDLNMNANFKQENEECKNKTTCNNNIAGNVNTIK